MKNTPWRKIEETLREAGSDDVPVRDRDAFWEAFKVRAEGETRNEPAPTPVVLFPAWVKAAACFAVIVTGAALFIPTPSNNSIVDAELSEITAIEVAAAHGEITTDESAGGTIVWVHGLELEDAGPNQIKAFDVAADHSAVTIMNDESTNSTILWVHGMELK